MGSPVVDGEGQGSSAHVHAKRAPGERRLEDSLSEIAGEEQAIRPVLAEGSEKAERRYVNILRLVDDAEIERRTIRSRKMPLKAAKQFRLRQPSPFIERGAYLGKDGPEDGALCLCQPRFSPQPRNVSVSFPALDLPRIDHFAPFRTQELSTEPPFPRFVRRPVDQFSNLFARGEDRAPEIDLVKAAPDGLYRVHFEAFRDVRLVVDQASEPRAQRIRERVGECREKDPGIQVRAGEMDGAMKRHDRLSCSGGSRYAGGAAIVAFDDPALRRVEEDGPFFPWVFERAFQFFHVRHNAKAALRVRMRERILVRSRRRRPIRHAAGRELQQRFGCLCRQAFGKVEQTIFVCALYFLQPFGGNAVVEQFVFGRLGEKRGLRRSARRVLRAVARSHGFAHGLANFDDLRRAGSGMAFDSSSFGPAIGLVVMGDIGEHQARCGPVDDQADVSARPDRPEIFVLRAVESVKR